MSQRGRREKKEKKPLESFTSVSGKLCLLLLCPCNSFILLPMPLLLPLAFLSCKTAITHLLPGAEVILGLKFL